MDKRESEILGGFLPEGFGYFTRDPKEEFPLVYKVIDGSLELLTKPNSSSANFFGVLRAQRSTFAEIGLIIQEVSEESWTKCASNLEHCISNKTHTVVEISNNKQNANVCGVFYVATQKPIPWAWKNSFKGVMPQRFIKLIINYTSASYLFNRL